jgi:hypothetical protein
LLSRPEEGEPGAHHDTGLRAAREEVTTRVKTAPAFASADEAMDMVHAGLRYLAAADATAMGAETQARCLQMLERSTAMGTAARSSILAAFTSGRGYCADADYSPRAWLIHKTRITRGAAAACTAWARRAAAHPEVAAALAAGGDVGVLRPGDLRLDRSAAAGLPGRRG